MRLVAIVFERVPMVWVLLGLLFFAGGLYLGFDYKLSFFYCIIGISAFVYGLLLFVFLRLEGTKKSTKRTLSPNFISVGATVAMRSASMTDTEEEPESGSDA